MANDIARLGRYVAERRQELGISQVELWQAGGPSNSTLTGLETGSASTISRATMKKLDKGLQWTPGSAQRVLEGGEPAKSLNYTEEFLTNQGLTYEQAYAEKVLVPAPPSHEVEQADAEQLKRLKRALLGMVIHADFLEDNTVGLNLDIEPDEIGQLVADIEDLFIDIDELVTRVRTTAAEAFGSEDALELAKSDYLERLRRKVAVMGRRAASVNQLPLPGLDRDDSDDNVQTLPPKNQASELDAPPDFSKMAARKSRKSGGETNVDE